MVVYQSNGSYKPTQSSNPARQLYNSASYVASAAYSAMQRAFSAVAGYAKRNQDETARMSAAYSGGAKRCL